MTLSEDGDDILGELMEEFLERRRRGEHPSLTEMVGRLPHREDEIRDLWPALVMLERTEPPADAVKSGIPLRRIGDYRIIREIGRGGMGIVYEAEQESLARRVALKLLPSADSKNARARFLREARVAAKLHHTNIVPVFHIGEEEGLHYYAMQFIQGCGMDKVLNDVRHLRHGTLPSTSDMVRSASLSLCAIQESTVDVDHTHAPPTAVKDLSSAVSSSDSVSDRSRELQSNDQYYRNIARLGLQTAEAVAYAHQHNVIHRDIKPSNLLLDSQGTIWVSDFGLVYTDDSNLTGTGDVVGTVKYMAPERFEGKTVPESDVYALGITLYELLTLEYPFEGADRAVLMKEVTSSEVPAPRKHAPDLPKDLDTIVRKATRPLPSERYRSATAMAHDLRCFLEGRPIVARPTPRIEQLYLWCKRRPLVSGLLASIILLVAVLATVSTVAAINLQQSLEDAIAAKSEEAVAKEKATRSLFGAYLTQADALANSMSPGRHFSALAAIENAAALQPQLELSEEDLVRMRTIAVRVNSADDLVVAQQRRGTGHPYYHNKAGFDRELVCVAMCDPDGQVRVRRMADGEILQELPGRWATEELPWTLVSPDGRFVVVHGAVPGEGICYMIWDCVNQMVVRHIESSGQNAYGRPAAFSPDSRQLALAVQKTIQLISLPEFTTEELCGVDGSIDFVKYSPDGSSLLFEQSPNACAILDVNNRSRIELTHDDWVSDADWGPTGRFVATSCSDAVVRVWDLNDPEEPITRCQGHASAARIVRFSPNGQLLVSWGWDSTTRIWHPFLGQEILRTSGRPANFNADGNRLSFEEGHVTVGTWKLSEAKGVQTYLNPTLRMVFDVAFHPDGNVIAIIGPSDLRLLTWPGLELMRTLDQPGEQCSFSTCGRFLLTASNTQVLQYQVSELIGSGDYSVVECATSDTGNGRICFSEEDFAGRRFINTGSRFLFHSAEGAVSADLPNDPDAWKHWFVSMSSDGKRVALTGKWSDLLIVKEIETGRIEFKKEEPGGCRTSFSPSGDRLVVCSTGKTEFFDTTDWQLLRTIQRNDHHAGNCAFSPDGKLIALHSRTAVHLLDADSLRPIIHLTPRFSELLGNGYPDGTCPLKFSPDGRYLASGTRSSATYVWDIQEIKSLLLRMNIGWHDADSP